MDIQQVAESLLRRLLSFVGIGRVTLTDDSKGNQIIQTQLGPEQVLEVRKMGHYGIAYCPPDGSDALVLFLGGNRQNGIVIGTENQAARIKNLKPGEAALYDNQGQAVYLTRGGIVIEGAGLPVTINGDLTVTGQVSDLRGTLDALREAYDTHTHQVPGAAAGNTVLTTLPADTPV